MSGNNPIVADKRPVKVSLEKGKKYFFCTCGKSAKQPFCDGAHKGSEFSPKAFEAEEDKDAFLCACKCSADSPFCDGAHKKLSEEDVGKEAPDLA